MSSGARRACAFVAATLVVVTSVVSSTSAMPARVAAAGPARAASVTADGTAPRAVASAMPVAAIGAAANASTGASRSRPRAAVVNVYQYGTMRAATIDRLERLALAVGVPVSRGRSAMIGLTAVRRGAAIVQAAGPAGSSWRLPLSVTVLPVDAAAATLGFAASAVLAQGDVVMGRTTADLRGAQAGDTLDLVGLRGTARRVTVGAVLDDAVVGGAELVIPEPQADALAVTSTTRLTFHGDFDVEALVDALAEAGFVDGDTVRIGRSDGAPNPDGLLGLAQVKSRLGEFAYRLDSSGAVLMDPAWETANIVRVEHGATGIRTRCHRVVAGDLLAALDAVVDAGLAGGIDVVNTNSYGGCYNPRAARASVSVGSLSRHSWGMAFDMNTVDNAQGSVPRLDCRIVRIFRQHGFAWGGNFLLPDGMHMEWVGEPRHDLAYPSEYCPNEFESDEPADG